QGLAVLLRGAAMSAALLGGISSNALAQSRHVPPASQSRPDSTAAPRDSSVAPRAREPEVAPVPGFLRVETIPSGLQILVDGVDVGISPIDSLRLSAKSVLVRAVASDPRRFDPARDAVSVTLR